MTERTLIEDLLEDPETAVVYLTALSVRGETIGQTILNPDLHESPSPEAMTHEDNVSITAAALLDALQREKQIDSDFETSDFLEEVIDEANQRKENMSEVSGD